MDLQSVEYRLYRCPTSPALAFVQLGSLFRFFSLVKHSVQCPEILPVPSCGATGLWSGCPNCISPAVNCSCKSLSSWTGVRKMQVCELWYILIKWKYQDQVQQQNMQEKARCCCHDDHTCIHKIRLTECK